MAKLDTTAVAGDVDHHETYTLIASDKVEGTSVYDPSGDSLGKIHNVMIDKKSGKIAYAVLSFGGFLGIGNRYHPLPWSVLTYDTDLDGYVVALDKDLLKNAPSYAAEDDLDVNDQVVGRRVHDYYQVPPYWI